MAHCLGLKKNHKILLQINSSYYNKMVWHNSRNKTRASVWTREVRCKQNLFC